MEPLLLLLLLELTLELGRLACPGWTLRPPALLAPEMPCCCAEKEARAREVAEGQAGLREASKAR